MAYDFLPQTPTPTFETLTLRELDQHGVLSQLDVPFSSLEAALQQPEGQWLNFASPDGLLVLTARRDDVTEIVAWREMARNTTVKEKIQYAHRQVQQKLADMVKTAQHRARIKDMH